MAKVICNWLSCRHNDQSEGDLGEGYGKCTKNTIRLAETRGDEEELLQCSMYENGRLL